MAKRLTELACERALPKAGRRLELFDGPGGVPGLALRITPRGVKSWSLMLRVAGKQRRVTLGRYPELGLADARRAARAALEQADRGIVPGRAGKATLASVAASYSERHVKRNRLRSATRIEQMLAGSILPVLGARPIGSIRRADVLDLADDIAARAPIMANRVQSLLKRLLAWAVERGELEASPIAGMRPAVREKSRARVLSDAELGAVWRAAGELGWPFGHITRLLILTAARRSEIAGLAWHEIDVDRGLWVKPAARTKAGREHVLPLSEAVLELLAGLPRVVGTDDLVFPARASNRPVSGFSNSKLRLDKLSGVADWVWHDLRRAAASGMARLGHPPHVIAEILGHSRATLSGVTSVYNRHGYEREARAALEAWATHVQRAAAGGATVIKLKNAAK
jgi:integrase